MINARITLIALFVTSYAYLYTQSNFCTVGFDQLTSSTSEYFTPGSQFADADNDGDLDFFAFRPKLVDNTSTTPPQIRLFQNNGTSFSLFTALTTDRFDLADINGDGRIDIVSVDPDIGNSLRLYINTGTSFTFTTIYTAPTNVAFEGFPEFVDYDNDGDLDISCGVFRRSNGAVFMLVNDGFLGFSLQELFPISGAGRDKVTDVKWADIDNDGDQDCWGLFDGADAAGNLRTFPDIHLNQGNGTFTGASARPPSADRSLLEDFDNDGTVDMIVWGDGFQSNNPGGSFRHYRGGSSGTNGFVGSTSTGTNENIFDIVTFDFDNNGYLDLMVYTSNSQTFNRRYIIYRNDGTSFTPDIFGPSTTFSAPYFADFNKDNTADFANTTFVIGATISINYFRGNAPQSTCPANTRPNAPTSLSSQVDGSSVSLSWLSSDANQNTASLTYEIFLRNQTTGQIIHAPSSDQTTGLRKVAAPGRHGSSGSWTFNNLPDGQYAWQVQAIDHFYSGSPWAAGDFQIGTAPCPAYTLDEVTDPGFSRYSKFADFDNDGDKDLIIIQDNGDNPPQLHILQNKEGTLPLLDPWNENQILAEHFDLGDADNDGDIDIVFVDNTAIYLLVNNNGTFERKEIFNSVEGWTTSRPAFLDYDNDGDLDVVHFNSVFFTQFNGLAFYENRGDLDFGPGTDYQFSENTVADLRVADFDNDGDTDVITEERNPFIPDLPHQINIYLNEEGTFTLGPNVGSTGQGLGAFDIGDIDNDGDLDVVGSGLFQFGASTRFYLNDNLNFVEVPVLNQGFGHLRLGDYNNDGFLDLAASTFAYTSSPTAPSVVEFTQLFQNTGGTSLVAENINFSFPNLAYLKVGVLPEWVDFNNDGILDIYQQYFATYNETNTEIVWRDQGLMYLNESTCEINTAPSPPSGLDVDINGSDVLLNWKDGFDPEQPSSSLSYKAFLYDVQNQIFLQPHGHPDNGYRHLVQMGNQFQTRSWLVKDLPDGEYCFKVQAIDHAYEGSSWSEELCFTILNCQLTTEAIALDPVICEGESANLRAISSGGTGTVQYQWNNGLGTGPAKTVTPTTTTIYLVTATDEAGCVATDTTSVVVNPRPAVEARPDTSICDGASITLIAVATGGSGGNYQFLWDNSLGAGPTHVVTPSSSTDYAVAVRDGNGCTNTDTANVIVNPRPVVIAAPDTAICLGDSVTLMASASGGSGGYTFTWDNGLGNGPTHTLAPDTSTTYSVTVTDETGCADRDQATIIVNPLPTVEARPDTAICLGDSVTLVALPSGGSGGNYQFLWNNGLGAGPSHTVSPTSSTDYLVALRDGNGCTDTDTASVLINLPPIVVATPDTSICLGETVSLTATASGGSGGYTYIWDNSLGTGPTHSVTPDTTITYSVTVTDLAGCTASDQVTITVNPLPIADAGRDTSICLGESLDLIAGATGGTGPPYSFNWDQGLGIGSSHSITPDTTTTYTVVVTDQNGCTDEDQIVVTVNELPNVVASPDTSVCAGNPVLLSAEATGGSNGNYSFSWDNGLGNGATHTVNPTDTTTYTVTVTDGNGCTAIDEVTVAVNPLPIVSASPDTSICVDASVLISATASGGSGTSYTFNWDNNLGTGASHTVNPTQTTIYTVTATDENGCSASAELTITVNPLPIVDLGPDTSICIGEELTLVAETSGGDGDYTYTWDNGLDQGQTQVVSPTVLTTYAVLVEDGSGCQDTDTITVLVNPLPGIEILSVSCDAGLNTYSVEAQIESTHTLLAASGTVVDNGGGSFSVTTIPSGTDLILTVNDPNLNCSRQETVTAPDCSCPDNIPPPVSGGDQSYCAGDDLPTLTVTVPDTLSVNWYDAPTGGQLLFQGSTGYSPAGPGTYYAESFVIANGCISLTRTAIILTELALPTVEITGDTTLCANTTSILTASGADTYLWSTDATTESIEVNQSGTYTVVGTAENGCSASATVQVSVAEPLTAVFDNQAILCNGAATGIANVQAQGGTPDYTYLWSNGVSTASNPGLPAGSYSVTITDSDNCSLETSTTLTEPEPINVSIDLDSVSCNGLADGQAILAITGGTPGYNILWPDQSNAVSRNDLAAGSYEVSISDINQCPTTALVLIEEPSALFIEPLDIRDASCSGRADGAISITVGGGTAPYEIQWSNGASGLSIEDLAAGTYDVSISDANNCLTGSSFTIGQPETLNISDTQISSATCEGVENGSIDITISGGTPPYSYSWSNGSTTQDLTGVGAGTYNVVITDQNQCDVSGNFTIGNATTLFLFLSSSDASCNEENGSVDLAIEGGTAPFSFDWNNDGLGDNDDEEDLQNLGAGEYFVSLTDANNCIAFSDTATLIALPPPIIEIISVTPSICGESSGAIDIEVSGGTPPYNYFWSNQNTNQDLSQVGEGLYTIIVTDQSDCSISQEVVVDCINPCSVAVGTMGAEKLMGCETEVLTASYDDTGEVIGPGEIRQFVIHNAAGTILGDVIFAILDEPTVFFIESQMQAGEEYYISAVVGKDNGNGQVDLSNSCLVVAAGTPFSFAAAPTAPAELSATNTILCVGQTLDLAVNVPLDGEISYLWETPRGAFVTDEPALQLENFTAMDVGDYFASYNINGCESEQLGPLFITLDESAAAVSAGEDILSCGDLEVTMAASLPSGTTGTWFTSSPARILEPENPNTVVDSLISGENIFIWIVNTGSCIVRDSVIVYHAVNPTTQDKDVLLAADKAALLLNKELLFDAITQTIPDSQLTFTIIKEPEFGDLSDSLAGLYYLRDFDVQEDIEVSFTYQVCNNDPECGALCSEANVNLTVKFLASEIISYKQALRPTGKNPVWNFTLLRNLSDARITIVDRWGQLIYTQFFDSSEFDLLKGNTLVGWEGQNNKGVQLPSGAYYFLFEGTLADGTKPQPEKGILYLLK